MLSLLTSVHLCLLSTRLPFYHSFDYHRGGGELWMIFLVLSLTYSLPSSSAPPSPAPCYCSSPLGFKRLSSSLAPRSSWPLPFICQPFDVVPAWAACYALPLTARPGVRGGLCLRTPPKLITPCLPPIHYYHLPPLLQMCLSPLPPAPRPPSPLPSLDSSLPQCPLLFYSLVLHSFHSGCGGRQTFRFIAYTCPWLSPSAGRDKTARGR